MLLPHVGSRSARDLRRSLRHANPQGPVSPQRPSSRRGPPTQLQLTPASSSSSSSSSSRSSLRTETSSPRRRQRRSRNCATFRKRGPFFHLVERARRAHTAQAAADALVLVIHDQLVCLQQRRALVESAIVNARLRAVGVAMDVTASFYDQFARGFDRVRWPDASRRAEAFLRAVMAEDVLCTEFQGVDPFLKQYEVTSRGHAGMVLTLENLRVMDGDGDESRIQIFAEATARFRISRATLERLFPSVVQDEELTQRLIGKQYELQYDKVFHFRTSDGRIFQHESRIDFCASLMKMVGDPFLALKLLEASIMTKHGHWKIDSRVREDCHELENAML